MRSLMKPSDFWVGKTADTFDQLRTNLEADQYLGEVYVVLEAEWDWGDDPSHGTQVTKHGYICWICPMGSDSHVNYIHHHGAARHVRRLIALAEALLAKGRGSAAIAAALTISEATAKTHIRNLRAKLGVGTRLEAVAEGLRLRLIDPPD